MHHGGRHGDALASTRKVLVVISISVVGKGILLVKADKLARLLIEAVLMRSHAMVMHRNTMVKT